MSFFGDLIRGATKVVGGLAVGGPAGAIAAGAGVLAGHLVAGKGGGTGAGVGTPPIQGGPGGWINLPGGGGPGVGIDIPGLPRIGIGERTTRGGINPPFGGAPGVGIGPVQIGGPAPGAATSQLPFVGAIGIQPEYRQRATATVPQAYRRRGVRYVLAADGLFYPKQMVPKQYRAWKPDPKPPITVRDHKAIIRADSARKRVKSVAQRAGLRMTTKARAAAPVKRGRK